MNPDLTPRQIEILRLRAQGRLAKEVAGELGLSEVTVKNHATRAYERLNVETAIEAFLVLGWLRVPEEAA